MGDCPRTLQANYTTLIQPLPPTFFFLFPLGWFGEGTREEEEEEGVTCCSWKAMRSWGIIFEKMERGGFSAKREAGEGEEGVRNGRASWRGRDLCI